MPTIKKRVSSPQVPEPPPQTWSNCLVVGNQVFIAGMTARTGSVVVGGDSVYEQSKAVFAKIKLLMEAAGGRMDWVILNPLDWDLDQLERLASEVLPRVTA